MHNTETSDAARDFSSLLQVFLYLQVLDLFTTLLGFRLGLGEASPFIGWLMTLGPATGVLLSKGIAVVLAGICIHLGRIHIIKWITYWYAALVIWNLTLLMRVS